MDLLQALKSKIESLENGEHSSGLRSVLLHIGTAFRHLARGQSERDDTAFTDAIYRTNQAFEGSIKEAYRVLAGRDPAHVRPFDIENYLEKENIFRARVLAQFTNYRKDWRNPSTHDYKLDFDEGEAFLAIISVSAFACLLIDQISGQLAYLKANRETEVNKVKIRESVAKSGIELLDRVVTLLKEFAKLRDSNSPHPASESQLIGALSGFFAAASPDLVVSVEVGLPLYPDRSIDLVLSDGDARVAVEIKGRYSGGKEFAGVAQVESYMEISGISSGVLLFDIDGEEFESKELLSPHGRIVIVKGREALPNLIGRADA